jgi:hypothetical protein
LVHNRYDFITTFSLILLDAFKILALIIQGVYGIRTAIGRRTYLAEKLMRISKYTITIYLLSQCAAVLIQDRSFTQMRDKLSQTPIQGEEDHHVMLILVFVLLSIAMILIPILFSCCVLYCYHKYKISTRSNQFILFYSQIHIFLRTCNDLSLFTTRSVFL